MLHCDLRSRGFPFPWRIMFYVYTYIYIYTPLWSKLVTPAQQVVLQWRHDTWIAWSVWQRPTHVSSCDTMYLAPTLGTSMDYINPSVVGCIPVTNSLKIGLSQPPFFRGYVSFWEFTFAFKCENDRVLENGWDVTLDSYMTCLSKIKMDTVADLGGTVSTPVWNLTELTLIGRRWNSHEREEQMVRSAELWLPERGIFMWLSGGDFWM